MDRFATLLARKTDDLLPVEIRSGPRTPQGHGLVSLANVQRIGVVFGEYRGRSDPHLRRRPRDPDGDLAAVGDQDAVQHVGKSVNRWLSGRFSSPKGASVKPCPLRALAGPL
jgi:hypothetical protein